MEKFFTCPKHILFLVLLVLSSTVFIKCTNQSENNAFEYMKTNKDDPFNRTIIKSEFFDIATSADTVIEGAKGTRIAIPAHCFQNEKGETVEGNVKFELAEALDMDDMLLSNLTTQLNGKSLISGGMLYLNAFSHGEKLHVDTGTPLYIEVPTNNKKPGMMVYKGTRDEKGNMVWVSPKPMENSLVSVDLSSLDFLPAGFKDGVDRGMPFHHHEVSTHEVVDSLYYSLSPVKSRGFVITTTTTQSFREDYQEAFYNTGKEIKNRKYTSASYSKNPLSEHILKRYIIETDTPDASCGIQPATIEVIKTKRFQNTLISTREFETRLQYIFKTCNQKALNLYIENLDKNLWEVDSMVSKLYGGAKNNNESFDPAKQFQEFAAQKLTKVQGASVNAKIMARYYAKRLKNVKDELERLAQQANKVLDKKNKEAEKIADEYKDVLWKREKYRMEKYGYQWTDLGWSNIDKPMSDPDPILPITLIENKHLNVHISDPAGCNRVYAYIVYKSIKSLYRLNSEDGKNFYPGNITDREMLMPNNAEAAIISIGYKDDIAYLGTGAFNTGKIGNVEVALVKSTEQGIRSAIKEFDDYKSENKINVDLEYQALFEKENLRQQQLQKESEFMEHLWRIAFPCCSNVNVGDSTRPEPGR